MAKKKSPRKNWVAFHQFLFFFCSGIQRFALYVANICWNDGQKAVDPLHITIKRGLLHNPINRGFQANHPSLAHFL